MTNRFSACSAVIIEAGSPVTPPYTACTSPMIFVMPPRLAGWLLHSPPPSVLKGSLPTPLMRLPSATKRPPWPFSQKPMEVAVFSRDGRPLEQ